MDESLAGRAHRAIEPLHAMLYFAPETEELLTGIGLRPGRMCYFANRAAPMGAVGAGVVTATFYNFNPTLIERNIPRAWTLASPADVLVTRLAAADAALRRLLAEAVHSDEVAELAALARRASAGCSPEGRPLYAGHAELDWPVEPHLQLWHAATLLREFRGDGHLAALVAAGLSGIEALITHTATGRGFVRAAAQATRGWSAEQWDDGVAGLQKRGLLQGEELTADGARVRDQVENDTNGMDLAPWMYLGESDTARLIELGKGLSRIAVGNGAFPAGVFGAART